MGQWGQQGAGHEARTPLRDAFDSRLAQLAREGGDPEEIRMLSELRVYQEELEAQNEELRRVHEDLARAHRRYFSLFDLSPIPYFLVDADSRILEINLRGAELFGRSRSNLLGTRLVQYLDPRGQNGLRNHLRSVIAGRIGKIVTAECRTVVPEGEGRILHIESLRSDQAEQSSSAILMACFDVTEARRAKEELRRSKEAAEDAASELEDTNRRLEQKEREARRLASRAEQSSRAKSEFLAAMSHEIRTPMNVILGMARSLLESGLEQDQRDYAEMVENAGNALLQVIDDILDYVWIEAGNLKIEEQRFDLQAALEEVVGILAPSSRDKGLTLHYLPSADLPRWVLGDARRFKQILSNLLNNAVKFTEAGLIEVVAETVRTDPSVETALVQVSVRDSGIGVPPEKRDLLFNAFEQADRTVTRRFGGSGLGLAICRRLCETMGGTIGYRPGEASGSVFFFSLPFDLPEPLADPRTARLEGKRLLMLDGCSRTRELAAACFDRWKVEAQIAPSPAGWFERAEEAASAGPPSFDAILMAVDEEWEQVRSLAQSMREARGEPPLILLSSRARGQLVEAVQDGTVYHVLERPLRPLQLKRVLYELLTMPRTPQHAGVDQDVGDSLFAACPMKVLLVEDNPANQRMAQVVFRKLGYTIDTASDGVEGIEVFDRGAYDLVVMDMQMPRKDGYQTIREIRQHYPVERQPWIIAWTAYALTEDRNKCLAAGADDYLSKPGRLDALKAAIRRGWEARQSKAT